MQTDFEKIHPNCIGGADYVIHSKKSTNNLSQTRSVARALICTNHIKKTMFTFHVPFLLSKLHFLRDTQSQNEQTIADPVSVMFRSPKFIYTT